MAAALALCTGHAAARPPGSRRPRRHTHSHTHTFPLTYTHALPHHPPRAEIQFPKYAGNDVEEAKAAFAELVKGAESLAATSAVRMKEIAAELQQIEVEKVSPPCITPQVG